MAARPIVTLTTDFGTADHYVGTMKGVLLSCCPALEIIDISHDIAPFSIHAGAYAIAQAAPYFPPGTIHVVVVDPGVGTARKALLVEAMGQIFIAPDNGVLSMIANSGKINAREITNQMLQGDTVSSTFHGRDVFAPVAAAIASGAAKPADVGAEVAGTVLLPNIEARAQDPGEWHGIVLSVDRFGNVITNLTSAACPDIVRSGFSLQIGNRRITTFRPTFGAAGENQVFAFFGSSGFIEIGIKQQSAAAHLNARPGDFVALRLLDLLK